MVKKKTKQPAPTAANLAPEGKYSDRPTKLDSKFYAAVTKVKDGRSVPDDEWMIFLAQDNAFPATLRFYLDECARMGADKEHCESVMRALRRLEEWRSANPGRCKVPGAKGEKLLG